MKKLLLLFLTCFLGLIGFAQETFDMPNATGTYLTGINDSGEICGYYTVASGNTIAFEINKYGDTITINPGSYSFCTVTGISNKGMLVGNYGSASNTAAAQGFIFLPNPGRNAGGIYNTTVTGSWGGTNMTASGITDDTCIAGSYQVGSNDDGALWCNSYSQVTDLRCNNQGTVFPTYLFDLDKNGNVGGFIIQGAQEQAAIYRGVSLGWDTFVVGGSIKSRVYGMNDNGWICGTFNNQTKGYYAQKLPGQNLAHLTQIYVKGSTTVFPFHINNNNEIIGYYTDNLGVDHGFIVAKYDIGFRPSVNAYSFVNLRTGVFPDSYTDQFQYNTDPYLNNGSTFPKNGANVWSKRVFPDWPDFVKSMAESGFYKMSHGTKVIDHIAYGIWSASASLTFSGSCFGLSNTAAQIFDKRSWYLGLFPDCAAFNGLNVYSYPLNDTTITAISQTQYKQWSKVYSAHQAAHQQDALAVTMQSLKQSLRNSRGRPHSVLIINIQNTGASHAVLPFKLVPGFQGNGIDTIYIYDSNFPGQDNLYVTVDMNSGSTGRFHYTAAGQIVDWGIGLFGDGLWMRGIDTMDLATQYVKSKHGDSPIYSRSNPLIQSYFNDSCKVHMTDDNDSVAVMSTDSNAATALITPMNNFSGVAGRQAIGAFSTSGITRVNKLTNSTFASNFLMVTDYTSLIRCDRISGTDTSDDYAFSQGSLTYINNDAANRGVAFTVDIDDSTSEYNYYVTGLNINPNNKVTVTTYGTTGMVLQNFGPPTTYIITTDFVTPTSEQTFHDSIVIGSNTQHIIQPHDTTNSGIYILVDTGMQGHYEDTIFINRTVNDINRINAPNITAWPVPGTNQLFMSGPKGMVSYSIFDVMGRVAATGEMDFGNGLVQKFDIVDLPPGFFIIQGTGKEGNWNYAFVKE